MTSITGITPARTEPRSLVALTTMVCAVLVESVSAEAARGARSASTAATPENFKRFAFIVLFLYCYSPGVGNPISRDFRPPKLYMNKRHSVT